MFKRKKERKKESPFGGTKNWQEIANNSPQAIAQRKQMNRWNNSPRMVAQRKAMEQNAQLQKNPNFWANRNSFGNENNANIQLKKIGEEEPKQLQQKTNYWSNFLNAGNENNANIQLKKIGEEEPKQLKAESKKADVLKKGLNTAMAKLSKMEEEPARDRSGTIQQAIDGWRANNLITHRDILAFLRNSGRSADSVRYVYTTGRGWIDLNHYFLVLKFGEFLADGLEPVSGNKTAQDLLFSPTANKSYYSYEDLPSNQFATELKLGEYVSEPHIPQVFKGEALYNAIKIQFMNAGATKPTNAPNWRKIPCNDQDRKRLPRLKSTKMVYSPIEKREVMKATYYTKAEQKELLKTGKYIPQNYTEEPLDLTDFSAAETSLEKTEKTKEK